MTLATLPGVRTKGECRPVAAVRLAGQNRPKAVTIRVAKKRPIRRKTSMTFFASLHGGRDTFDD